MDKLIEDLEKYLRLLNVEQLYKEPGHKNSKDWLAGVAAVLKSNRKSSYKRFSNLSQHIYPSVSLKTRKHAAEQIDVFLRQIIAEYKAGVAVNQNSQGVLLVSPSTVSGGKDSSEETYVNRDILEGFKEKRSGFDYEKLTTLIEELNFNYESKKTYSSCMILRAILDHIPPLLAKREFAEVVNNYSWGGEKSSRQKAVKELLRFRNVPDDVLHGQITNRNDVIDISYLPDKFSVNTLLQECLKSDVEPSSGSKAAKVEPAKSHDTKSGLKVDLGEHKVSWANYAVGRRVWSSFRIILLINNFRNNSPEYLRAHLVAKSGEKLWEAKNFLFWKRDDENKSTPNEDLRIEAGYKEKVSLFISDREVGNSDQRPRPNFDDDTLSLVVETESGDTFTLPIKPGWIVKG